MNSPHRDKHVLSVNRHQKQGSGCKPDHMDLERYRHWLSHGAYKDTWASECCSAMMGVPSTSALGAHQEQTIITLTLVFSQVSPITI